MVIVCSRCEDVDLEFFALCRRQDDCYRQIRQIEKKIKNCNGDEYKKKKLSFHRGRLQEVALPRIKHKFSTETERML